MRRSKPVDPNGDRRGHIKDIVSIRQRPAAVEDRAVPGHWEGEAALKAMHEHVAYGNMILALPNALRTATATLDGTGASKALEAMQEKLSTIQKLIKFQD
jgi:IS30 family transposase